MKPFTKEMVIKYFERLNDILFTIEHPEGKDGIACFSKKE